MTSRTLGDVLNLSDHSAERGTRLQVEGNGGGGELAVVIDGLRPDVGYDVRQGLEGNELAGCVLEIEHRERVRIGLILGQ